MDLKNNEFPLQWLPRDCEPNIQGDPMGADRQYRCDGGLHIRQYGDQLIGHYDKVDPREDFFGHLLVDAPEKTALAAGGGAALAAVAAGRPDLAPLVGIGVGLGILLLSALVTPDYE